MCVWQIQLDSNNIFSGILCGDNSLDDSWVADDCDAEGICTLFVRVLYRCSAEVKPGSRFPAFHEGMRGVVEAFDAETEVCNVCEYSPFPGSVVL